MVDLLNTKKAQKSINKLKADMTSAPDKDYDEYDDLLEKNGEDEYYFSNYKKYENKNSIDKKIKSKKNKAIFIRWQPISVIIISVCMLVSGIFIIQNSHNVIEETESLPEHLQLGTIPDFLEDWESEKDNQTTEPIANKTDITENKPLMLFLSILGFITLFLIIVAILISFISYIYFQIKDIFIKHKFNKQEKKMKETKKNDELEDNFDIEIIKDDTYDDYFDHEIELPPLFNDEYFSKQEKLKQVKFEELCSQIEKLFQLLEFNVKVTYETDIKKIKFMIEDNCGYRKFYIKTKDRENFEIINDFFTAFTSATKFYINYIKL